MVREREVSRVARKRREETMTMKNARDLFAQTDQQVSVLKDRIDRQREAIKQAKP